MPMDLQLGVALSKVPISNIFLLAVCTGKVRVQYRIVIYIAVLVLQIKSQTLKRALSVLGSA